MVAEGTQEVSEELVQWGAWSVGKISHCFIKTVKHEFMEHDMEHDPNRHWVGPRLRFSPVREGPGEKAWMKHNSSQHWGEPPSRLGPMRAEIMVAEKGYCVKTGRT